MPRKHYTSEEIIKLLRLVEIEVGKGKTIGHACKQQGFDLPPVTSPPVKLDFVTIAYCNS